MDSIIKSKMTDVEAQFNEVAESIEAKNEQIKKLQKEVFDEESKTIFLRGKYEGLTEALELFEAAIAEVKIAEGEPVEVLDTEDAN